MQTCSILNASSMDCSAPQNKLYCKFEINSAEFRKHSSRELLVKLAFLDTEARARAGLSKDRARDVWDSTAFNLSVSASAFQQIFDRKSRRRYCREQAVQRQDRRWVGGGSSPVVKFVPTEVSPVLSYRRNSLRKIWVRLGAARSSGSLLGLCPNGLDIVSSLFRIRN